MRVTFLGAAGEVTGSNILVEAGGRKILLDCGLFQGSNLADYKNFKPFAFKPMEIDLVVVCHAHLDHTGRLPKLVNEGFGGRIVATAPTKDITALVLEDNAKLMLEEAKRNHHQPLYYKKDIGPVLAMFESFEYSQKVEVFSGVNLTLHNAGHILGSSTVTVEAEGKTLAYTSDLGNRDCELLSDPEVINSADYVICEATYGGRVHEDPTKREAKLSVIINRTIAQNGVLMIPSFAIERAQELLHDIEHFCKSGNCLIPTFYLDSPMADKVTQIFEKYPQFLSPDLSREDPDVFGLNRVRIAKTSDDSKEIDSSPNPKIIIAGSGMMNGGRILFHLQKYIEDEKNSILIIGYQGEGTLGRRIFDGEGEIKIFGKKYKVGAGVFAIGSYSAHADSIQLIDWLSKIKNVKKLFLVHAESHQAESFKKLVEERLNVLTYIPAMGEAHEL